MDWHSCLLTRPSSYNENNWIQVAQQRNPCKYQLKPVNFKYSTSFAYASLRSQMFRTHDPETANVRIPYKMQHNTRGTIAHPLPRPLFKQENFPCCTLNSRSILYELHRIHVLFALALHRICIESAYALHRIYIRCGGICIGFAQGLLAFA